MINILFTNCPLNKKQISQLKKESYNIIPERADLNQKELIEILNKNKVHAAIVGGNEKYNEEVFKNCKDLKMVQFFGIGYQNYVNLKDAEKYKVIVANTPKVNSYSVAEYTLGLICALNQKIVLNDQNCRNGVWEQKSFFDLKGKTIGIVGMGNIGTRFAKIMRDGFGCKIIFNDIVPKKKQERMFKTKQVSLNEVFKNSDIVSMHVPLTDLTRNFIGEKQFRLMKKHALFINDARANVVDFKALAKCLDENIFAGCAFDGFYQEPINLESEEAKALLKFKDKFIITPHTAFNAVEAVERMTDMSLGNIKLVFSGKNCKNIVSQCKKVRL